VFLKHKLFVDRMVACDRRGERPLVFLKHKALVGA